MPLKTHGNLIEDCINFVIESLSRRLHLRHRVTKRRMKNIQTGVEEIKQQIASKLRKRKPNIKPKKIYNN